MRRLGIDIGIHSIGWAIYNDENQEIKAGVRIFPRGNNIDGKNGKESSKNQIRQTARSARRQNMRYKLRRKRLRELLLSHGFGDFSAENNAVFQQSSKNLYELRKKALYEKVTLTELGRIFYMLNQRRGFHSSRKDVQDKDAGVVKESIKELNEKIAEAGCKTVGEYFYTLFVQNEEGTNADEPVERIRNRYLSRLMYLTEFDEIWKKQKEYYPELLTGEPIEDKKAERDNQKDTLFYELKYKTIFYQRDLKSAKHLVLNCDLETKFTKEKGKIIYSQRKRAAPKSCFDFQTYRILTLLHNIRVGKKNSSEFQPLNLDQIHILFDLFRKQAKITPKEVIQKLNLGKDAVLNYDKSGGSDEDANPKVGFKGDGTSAKIYEVLGEKFSGFDAKQQERIWELLYFAKDNEWLEKQLMKDSPKYQWDLSADESKKLSTIQLELDYCRYSRRALKKLNKEMYNGKNLSDSLDALYVGKVQKSEKVVVTEYLDFVPTLANNELRNPLVQMAINETIRVVNTLIKKYGKFDEVNVELARDLRKPKEKREEMYAQLLQIRERKESFWKLLYERGLVHYENINKDLLEKYELWLELDVTDEDLFNFKPESNIRKIKEQDREKYQLWKECDRISPYSGKTITLSALFSHHYQVDHIIPYSKCLDDSKANKTICTEEENREKGNRMPSEYLTPWAFQAMEERLKGMKNMSEHKKERFLMRELPSDFINAQLNATAQVGKAVELQLKQTFKTVNVTTGQITAQLRELWKLGGIISNNELNVKDRSDHRHHAIDAIVTSLITRKMITDLSTDSSFNRGKNTNSKVFDMFTNHLRNQTVEILANMLISYRAVNKATSTRSNPYKHHKNKEKFQKENGNIKRSLSVRGPMHEETIYGKIKVYDEKTKKYIDEYVVRKPLSWFSSEKQLDKIIDKTVREIVKERFNENGKKFTCFTEQALKEKPLYMYSTKGVLVPIKKVRVSTNDNPIPIRGTSNPEKPHLVEPGNNYCIVIYEGKVIEHKGKKAGSYVLRREFETVSLLEAVKRKKQGLPIYSPTKNNLPKLMTLFTNDLVVLYEDNPKEIDWNNMEDIAKNRLYKVVKFDRNGEIALAKHTLAKPDFTNDYPKMREIDSQFKKALIRISSSKFKAIKVKINAIGEIERPNL